MADCSKTECFLAEWQRMCHTVKFCADCDMRILVDGMKRTSKALCMLAVLRSQKEAVAVVQKWSDEHPTQKQKTYADVFLEKFPTATINACADPGARPYICRQDVFGEHGSCEIGKLNCLACWNEPYKEDNNG